MVVHIQVIHPAGKLIFRHLPANGIKTFNKERMGKREGERRKEGERREKEEGEGKEE